MFYCGGRYICFPVYHLTLKFTFQTVLRITRISSFMLVYGVHQSKLAVMEPRRLSKKFSDFSRSSLFSPRENSPETPQTPTRSKLPKKPSVLISGPQKRTSSFQRFSSLKRLSSKHRNTPKNLPDRRFAITPESESYDIREEFLNDPFNYEPKNLEEAIFKEAFSMFDKDQDGSINSKKLGIVMRSFGLDPTDNELSEMIAEVDKDETGDLHFPEFLKLLQEEIESSNCEGLIRDAFEQFDTGSKGFITQGGLGAILNSHSHLKMTDTEISEIIEKTADIDDDGQISFDDFYRVFVSEDCNNFDKRTLDRLKWWKVDSNGAERKQSSNSCGRRISEEDSKIDDFIRNERLSSGGTSKKRTRPKLPIPDPTEMASSLVISPDFYSPDFYVDELQ